MKTKKILAFILICVSVVCGCQNRAVSAVYDDDSELTADYDTYHMTDFKGSQENGSYKASAREIEGMYTVSNYDSESEEELDITYQISVESGKMKLVLIDPEGELMTLSEVSEESGMEDGRTVNVLLKKGKNRLKIVAGKDTSMNMELTVSKGELSGT